MERLKVVVNVMMLNYKYVIMLSNVFNVEMLIVVCVKMW